jgi:hypothetical protein
VTRARCSGNGDDVGRAIARGLELARTLGDGEHEIRLLAGLNIFLTRIGDFAGALKVADESVAAARRVGGRAGIVMAESMLGVSHHLCGNQMLAQVHCERGLERAAASELVRITFFGYDHRVRALVALSRALWLRGLSERAVTVARQAIDEAVTLNQPVDVCISLIYGEAVFGWRGDWEEAQRVIDLLTEYAERHSLSPYRAVATALKGELLVKTGRPEEGCRLLSAAASRLKAERHAILATVFAGALAEGWPQPAPMRQRSPPSKMHFLRPGAVAPPSIGPSFCASRAPFWHRGRRRTNVPPTNTYAPRSSWRGVKGRSDGSFVR